MWSISSFKSTWSGTKWGSHVHSTPQSPKYKPAFVLSSSKCMNWRGDWPAKPLGKSKTNVPCWRWDWLYTTLLAFFEICWLKNSAGALKTRHIRHFRPVWCTYTTCYHTQQQLFTLLYIHQYMWGIIWILDGWAMGQQPREMIDDRWNQETLVMA